MEMKQIDRAMSLLFPFGPPMLAHLALPPPKSRNEAGMTGACAEVLNGHACDACTLFLTGKSSRKIKRVSP